MPTAPSPHCARFPVEIWENALLGLTPQGILSLRLLNREFRDLIDFSPAIQYRIDLCSSELEEGTVCASKPLDHRRKLLESYSSRWNYFDHAEEFLLQPLSGDPALVTKFGHIAYNTRSGPGTKDICFVRLPPGSTGGSQKDWVVHGIPGGACNQHAIHPPSGLLAALQVVDEERSFRIHLLQMNDGRPHPSAIDSIITGPIFPPSTHIVEGELQLTGHRLAVRVALREPSGKSEHLVIWDWKTGEKYMETINSHCVRAEFIDDYRLLVAVTSWITTPQLWDTAIAAQAGSSSSVEFGLGPDYTIDAGLGNPFYFNLGSSHDAPFHEDASRQLVGIRVVSRSRSRRGSTLLVIRYGDLVKLTSQKKTWVKWETWRNLITPIEFEPDVQEFGLLRSHLLATCKDLKDSATLLRVYDFTVRSRRQQGREKAVSDCLPPYTLREFLLGTGVGPLSEFLFTEDTVLASAGSVDGTTLLLLWAV